jgi:hypothetical protein
VDFRPPTATERHARTIRPAMSQLTSVVGVFMSTSTGEMQRQGHSKLDDKPLIQKSFLAWDHSEWNRLLTSPSRMTGLRDRISGEQYR